MTYNEIISALQYDMDMMLFDATTGEKDTKESLKYGNPMNYTVYCAKEEAIEILTMIKMCDNCKSYYDVIVDVLKRRFDAKFLFAEPKSTDEHIYHGAVMALKILQNILDDPTKHIPSIIEIENIFNRGCVDE